MRKNIAEFHALQSLNEVRPAQEPRTVDVDFLEHRLDARGQLLARHAVHKGLRLLLDVVHVGLKGFLRVDRLHYLQGEGNEFLVLNHSVGILVSLGQEAVDLVRREAHTTLQIRHQCLELSRIQRLAVVFVVALEEITHNVLHVPDVHGWTKNAPYIQTLFFARRGLETI